MEQTIITRTPLQRKRIKCVTKVTIEPKGGDVETHYLEDGDILAIPDKTTTQERKLAKAFQGD